MVQRLTNGEVPVFDEASFSGSAYDNRSWTMTVIVQIYRKALRLKAVITRAIMQQVER